MVADYYELLGVAPTASTGEIRKAYLRLAREKHPDRFSEGPEKDAAGVVFQDLTTAFNTLCNERSRREYDETRGRPRPTTPEEIARDAFERSSTLLGRGALDEAVTLLRTAVHHAPETAEYHAALGRALSRDPAAAREAIQELDRAAKLAPRDAAVLADLAILLHRQGLRLRAQRSLEAARRLGPGNPRVTAAASEIGGPRS
jgi:curved DNA-binding protein CbpA